MTVPKFDPKEMEIVVEIPGSFMMPGMKIYNYPVTEREAFIAAMSREPVWQISSMMESRMFIPRIIPDNIARSFVFEAKSFDPNKGGGKDMFGME